MSSFSLDEKKRQQQLADRTEVSSLISFSFDIRAALRSLVSFSLCKGTLPSLELRALSPELPLRSFAWQKGSLNTR